MRNGVLGEYQFCGKEKLIVKGLAAIRILILGLFSSFRYDGFV